MNGQAIILALLVAVLAACGDEPADERVWATEAYPDRLVCTSLHQDIEAVYAEMGCDPATYYGGVLLWYWNDCLQMPEPPTPAEVGACHDELLELDECGTEPPPACRFAPAAGGQP